MGFMGFLSGPESGKEGGNGKWCQPKLRDFALELQAARASDQDAKIGSAPVFADSAGTA